MLQKHDLYLKPEKCSFEQEEIDYLGVIVGKDKLEMDPQKLSGVADWPTPKNPTDVRSFLGFTGYYRYFVPNYSKIARPLLDLITGLPPVRGHDAILTIVDHGCSRSAVFLPCSVTITGEGIAQLYLE